MSKEYTIDAKGKKLGRVASEVATLLMGKHEVDYAPHQIAGTQVTIVNASQVDIAPKKRTQKEYVRNTGYPGGLRKESMQHVIDNKGYQEVFKKAVYGMLPANKLRAPIMKNLTIVE